MKQRFSYEGELAYYREKAPTPPQALARVDAGPYLRALLDDPRKVFEGVRVLDAGAGGCLYSRYIAERLGPRRLVALDLALQHPDYTRLADGSRLRFVVGDLFRLPLPDASVDVVLINGVLSQIPNLGDALAEVRRVLVPHGRFVGWEPNPFNPVIAYRFFARAHSPNQYLFWPRRVRPEFERAGFEVDFRYFYARLPGVRSRFLGTCIGILGRAPGGNGAAPGPGASRSVVAVAGAAVPAADRPTPPSPIARRAVRQIREAQTAHHKDLPVPDFPRVEKVVRRVARERPGRLLDLGYARDGFADSLARLGWQCVGLDLQPPRQTRVRAVVCDLTEGFPVADASFDAITAGEIIEHMLDEDAFVEDCRKALKPGGLLALTTPNLSFLVNRFLVLFGRTPMFVHAPFHYHFHTRDTLVKLVERHGFEVEELVASHVLYSRRRFASGSVFEWLADVFPTLGAHLILFARKR